MSKKKKKSPIIDEVIEDESDSAISLDENKISIEDDADDPVKALENDLQKTKDKLAEQEDKFIRLQAETDNFRKRLAREKDEFSQYANER